MSLFYVSFDSPIGQLTVAADALGLRYILFAQNRHPPQDRGLWRHDAQMPVLLCARAQLLEYLDGQRTGFELPLAAPGTAFQLRVWAALEQIPYGQTWSYGELARHIGQPAASRAVGAANGRNPLPIVRPCHRVIGSQGAMTGFAGGLPTKIALLELEGALLPQRASASFD
jgi:methylated-DNA-[protein]-cysteine S-methyltransferase